MASLLGIDKIFVFSISAFVNSAGKYLYIFSTAKILDVESGKYEMAGYVITNNDLNTIIPEKKVIDIFFNNLKRVINFQNNSIIKNGIISAKQNNLSKSYARKQDYAKRSKIAVVSEYSFQNDFTIDKRQTDAGRDNFVPSDVITRFFSTFQNGYLPNSYLKYHLTQFAIVVLLPPNVVPVQHFKRATGCPFESTNS